jgi:hypothetical protein
MYCKKAEQFRTFYLNTRHVNLPVMLSQRIREVIMRPYGLKRFSRSCWAMFFGSPLTYRFAPFIASLLGRAYDTWKEAKAHHHSCTLLLRNYVHTEVYLALKKLSSSKELFLHHHLILNSSLYFLNEWPGTVMNIRLWAFKHQRSDEYRTEKLV